jgi:hypothetical protein
MSFNDNEATYFTAHLTYAQRQALVCVVVLLLLWDVDAGIFKGMWHTVNVNGSSKMNKALCAQRANSCFDFTGLALP